MEEHEAEEQSSGPQLRDLINTVFRHKWKIVASTVLGLCVAAFIYCGRSPLYQSQAKLLVRYVLDRNGVDPALPTSNSGAVIGSEVEILTSWDLATEAAESIGFELFFPDTKNPLDRVGAASVIVNGLSVVRLKDTDVMLISYKHRDPVLAKRVLEEVVSRYLLKHLEIHRSKSAQEFVGQQTDSIRRKLNQTEEELRKVKVSANVISLSASTTSLTAEAAKIQDELYGAVAERAEQTARVSEIERSLATNISGRESANGIHQSEAVVRQPKNGDVQQYGALVSRLAQLRQVGLDLLSKYTPENSLVKLNQAQIGELEGQRAKLEERYPNFTARPAENQLNISQQVTLNAERARLAGVEARIQALGSRDHEIKERSKQFSETSAAIFQLERKRDLEEADYRYYAAALEKARVDNLLDPKQMPNISKVQEPSPAVKIEGNLNKILLGIAGGGLAIGLTLAFLIDLLLDTSIKLPSEFQTRLHLPLLLSIPFSRRGGRIHAVSRKSDSALTDKDQRRLCLPWEPEHFIRGFSEAIRDRLVLYFELKKMIYKPKLIAVTSCTGGEGVSTIAAGLAAALSEAGEGKVLLVDMNGDNETHRFFEGKQSSSLAEAIERDRAIPAVSENLYLASAAGSSQITPKRFYDLVPHFKATHFDYIIFDMPPLAQGSVALAMSSFMDKILLVTESEKNSRGIVKRHFDELVSANADVAVIFNKARSYAPQWLQGIA